MRGRSTCNVGDEVAKARGRHGAQAEGGAERGIDVVARDDLREKELLCESAGDSSIRVRRASWVLGTARCARATLKAVLCCRGHMPDSCSSSGHVGQA